MNYLKKGMYALMFITAISCSKDDDGETVLESISGLDFTISVENDKGNEIGVTPTSDLSSNVQYSIDFADDAASDDADVLLSSGPKAKYTYPEASATYTIVVTASASGYADTTVSKEVVVEFVGSTILADFENPSALNLRDDLGDGATITIESQTGADGSTTNVGVITNVGLPYEAPSINLTSHIDVRNKSVITMDFYQSEAVAQVVLMKLEQKLTDNEASKPSIEVKVDTAAESGWQTLTFDYGTEATNSYTDWGDHNQEVVLDQYQKMVIFVGFGVELSGTFWVDNIAGGELGDPVPDTDGDGVMDSIDKCKDLSGTEANGCNPAVVGVDPTDDFEGNGNITWVGDNAGADVVDNPYPTGINTSAKVMKYNDTGAQYANIRFDLADGGLFDLSTKNVVKVKVYVPSPDVAHTESTTLWLKLQDGTSNEPWASQTQVSQVYEYDKWQVLTFDFSAASDVTNYNRLLFQFNGENNYEPVTAYIDDISYGAPVNPNDDNEGAGNITWLGDNAGADVVDNPYSTGINTSAKVMKYNDTGAQYANIQFTLSEGQTFDLADKAIFKVKVYVPTPATAHAESKILWLKLQDGTSSEPWNGQVVVENAYEYDTWTELTFDFSANAATTNFNRVVLQFNGENNYEPLEAYIDDFKYVAE
ncbi:MAG: hypothetical protein VW127_00890 [Flavobacteriaceae bacterium]